MTDQRDNAGRTRFLSDGGNEIKIEAPKIKRVIPLEEVREHQYFWDLADLAEIFNHEVVEIEDNDGTWRWKPNRLMRLVDDHIPVYTPSSLSAYADGSHPYTRNSKTFRASLDLNTLVMDLHAGLFSMEEWMKFYMQIGYSLGGYCEVFGQHEASEYKLEGAKERTEEHEESDEYAETVIDYMRRIHEGKVLKL